MRIKLVPEDFRVEEILALPCAARGAYAVYRVHKRGRTTLEVQEELARLLGLPPSAVRFPALKDKVAVATQYASAKVGRRPSLVLRGRGFRAEGVGFLPRPLAPGDLAGNRFTVTLRDLAQEELPEIKKRAVLLGRQGFPNYFDLQRFGSWSRALGFPGKLLLQRDWEGALRAYLCEPLLGDPPPVRRFKKLAKEQWGNFRVLKEAAPRGNLRSVLTFLCDHPEDFKRAVNLITPRILSLWLSAYQSFLWNRVASVILRGLVEETSALNFPWGAVALPRYPLPEALFEKLRGLELPLPHAKALEALFPAPKSSPPRAEEGQDKGELLRSASARVLEEEGLSPRDLRARGLERAYLPKGTRSLWVLPEELAILGEGPDERFPGKCVLLVTFTLPPGSYATLFLRLLSPTTLFWARIPRPSR